MLAADRAQYQVAWQLPEEDEDQQYQSPGSLPGAEPDGSKEHLESWARFAGLLAGADFASVVTPCGHGLKVEVGDPSAPWLRRGTVVETHPCSGYAGSLAFGLLLSGRLRWCHCSPPPGFGRAVLLASPRLAGSGRLLLVAKRETGFPELNLRAATAYLAQANQVRRRPGRQRDHRSPAVDLATISVLDLRCT